MAVVDFSRVLTTFEGEPIHTPAVKDEGGAVTQPGRPLTLKLTCLHALSWDKDRDGKECDLDAKVTKYCLAQRIAAAFLKDRADDGYGRASLSADEVVLLKKCVGVVYGTVVVGQAVALLDPKE